MSTATATATTTSTAEAEKEAARVVSVLYEDEALRTEFMNLYNTDPDSINSFMVEKLDMPQDLADTICALKGDPLTDYIGKLVCGYIW
ncbi:MAG: hypothetical protein AAF281_04655 [Pseudomonadota bacterium]